MADTHLSLREINDLDEGAFVARLGFLFEGSPWIAQEAWHRRPFRSLEHLHSVLCDAMYAAPMERQVALIGAHPDLVGRAALAGTLTPESTREQAAAGLDRLSPEEIERFTHLNRSYREQFGFPFVICARENKKESILRGFETRLHHSGEEEITTALREIGKIAWLRLRDVARADG